MGAAPDPRQGPALRGPQGRAVLPALRHRAVLARGRRSGYKDVVDPVGLRALPGRDGRARRAGGRQLLVWTTTPWTLVSNAAVAVDPDLDLRRATAQADERRRSLAEALVERVLGEGTEILDRFPGRDLEGVALRAAVPFIAGERIRRPRATPSCSATSSPPTTARASSTPRSPSARTTSASASSTASPSSTRSGSTGPTTSASGPTRGASSRTPTPTWSTTSRRAAGCSGRATTSTPTRTAGAAARRCSTTPSPSWYIATSQLRDRLLAANETVNWHPEHVKHGRFGKWLENNVDWALSPRALLGHAAAGVALRRTRTTCTASARFAELEELSGVALEDPHRPYVDDVASRARSARDGDAPRPRGHRRVVRLGLHAVRPVPRAVREPGAFEARFPADFICEALDQTRGWFYSLLAVSTLLFDRASVRERRLPRPDPRRRGPEDVEVQGQHRRARGTSSTRYGADAFRWYFFTSKQPWDGYRFSTETVGEGVRLFLRQLWNTYGFYVLYANANDVDEAAGPTRADRPRPLGRCRAWPRRSRRSPSGWTTTTRRPPAARSPSSSTTSRTGTCAARAGASGRATRAAFATLRDCLVTMAQAARAVLPVHRRRDLRQPRRRRAVRPPLRLPRARRARPRARGRHGGRARGGAARARRARAGEGQGPPAAARGRGRRRRVASARRSSAWPTSCATSSTSRSCASSRRADELGSYEVKPNYRTLGPRFVGLLKPGLACVVNVALASRTAHQRAVTLALPFQRTRARTVWQLTVPL